MPRRLSIDAKLRKKRIDSRIRRKERKARERIQRIREEEKKCDTQEQLAAFDKIQKEIIKAHRDEEDQKSNELAIEADNQMIDRVLSSMQGKTPFSPDLKLFDLTSPSSSGTSSLTRALGSISLPPTPVSQILPLSPSVPSTSHGSFINLGSLNFLIIEHLQSAPTAETIAADEEVAKIMGHLPPR